MNSVLHDYILYVGSCKSAFSISRCIDRYCVFELVLLCGILKLTMGRRCGFVLFCFLLSDDCHAWDSSVCMETDQLMRDTSVIVGTQRGLGLVIWTSLLNQPAATVYNKQT